MRGLNRCTLYDVRILIVRRERHIKGTAAVGIVGTKIVIHLTPQRSSSKKIS